MKKLLVVLIAVLSLIPLCGFARTEDGAERIYVPADRLFETYIDSEVSLMSGEDSLEDILVSAWKNLEEDADIKEFCITEEAIGDVYRKILYQNPELYYVNGAFYYGADDGYVDFIYPLYFETDLDVINETLDAFETEANEMLFLVNGHMSDFDKVMTIHDYMVEHYSYDWDFYYRSVNGEASEDEYEPYTMLIMTRKTGVCQGYALTFSYMMQKLGIDCVYVSSDDMDHGWNLVKVDGEWYHIDITWDDTDIYAQIGHEYELLSTERIMSLPSPHYGFDLGDLVADSTLYDDAPWHSSIAEIAFCHGKDYWIDGDKIVDQNGNNIYTNLAGIDGDWDLGDGYYLRNTVMTGLAEFNGKIYYNTDEGIYSFDPETKARRLILKEEAISGLYIDKNELKYSKAVIKSDDQGLYVDFVDGGSITLNSVRVCESYEENGKIITKVYNDSHQSITFFSVSGNGVSSKIVESDGYATVAFDATDSQTIYCWGENLKPLRHKELVEK